MGQFNWTYLGDNGRKFNVGLFHGPRTGHLMIHCNSKVVQIDFSVRDSKTYSFFLDEELCEIELERKGEQFFYHFNINKDVDTPLNRARKAREKKHWRQSLTFFGGLLLCAALFSIWFTSMKSIPDEQYRTELLSKTGVPTVAKIELDNNKDGSFKMKYSFVANGQGFQSDWEPLETNLLPNGMPLRSGDEFQVIYALKKPEINKIDLDQPSETQVKDYFRLSFNLHLELNPELTASKVNCLLNVAYELKGIEGLAYFYFQDETAQKNPKYNSHSFLRFTRDLPFQKKSKEACL